MSVMAQTSPHVTLVQPDVAGIEIVIGDTYLISWEQYLTGSGTVDIDYSTNGADYTSITTGVLGTTYSWDTDGLSAATTYTIRVKSTDDPTLYKDVSANDFSLVTYPTGGTIEVLSPNLTGIQWANGTSHLISWTGNGGTPVKIELWKGASLDHVIVASTTGSTYGWDIPDDQAVGTDYSIKVFSTAPGSSVSDESDNDFEITEIPVGGWITVLQPSVASIQWARETTHLISWTDNMADSVLIQLYKSTWSDTATLVAAAGGSTWLWTIADTSTLGSDYEIIISSKTDTTVNDVSDNNFEITETVPGGTITVIQPSEAGIEWGRGSTHLISWSDNLTEPVKIELYKGASKDSDITTSTTGGTYSWTIPSGQTVGTDYSVIVTSTVSSSVNDESDNDFEISLTEPGGAITVIQPDLSGIQWANGTNHLISWTDNIAEPVDIELWKGSSKDSDIDTDVTGSTYSWDIPGAQATGTDYSIKVLSTLVPGTVLDESDNDFEITETVPGGYITVIQANGGEEWLAGGTYLLSWDDNISENVKIELSENSGSSYGQTLVSSTSGSTWVWDTDATPPSGSTTGSDYRIKISSVTSGASASPDESDADFSFVNSLGGTVTVVQPNGGEEWESGTSHIISWNDDVVEDMDIWLVNTTTEDTTSIATDVAGSTYSWAISSGQANGTGYKICICSSVDSASITDYSDAVFEITDTPTGGSFITVVAPNGGEEWESGVTYLISWNDDVIEDVDIWLVNTTEEDTTEIADNVSGTTYSWAIPSDQDNGTGYKINICSTTDSSSLYDYSDAVFEITDSPTGGSYIDIIQPNGGESWIRGTAHLISWMDDVVEDVNIWLVNKTTEDTTSVADTVSGTTYAWTIPSGQAAGTEYQINISSISDSATLNDTSDAVFTITVSKAPGSSNIGINGSISSNVTMYPNPTTGQLTLSANGNINSVIIRNLLGQILYNNNVEAVKTNIDVSNYEAGVYIVNVMVEGEIVTKKLFVH